MKNIFLLFLLSVSYSVFSQNNSVVDWNTDFDFIRTELPKNHYNFFMVRSEQDFHDGLARITNQLEQLSDFEAAIKLQQLIASFGDSHTMLGWQTYLDPSKVLPLGLMWFSDGIWITATTHSNETILGSKLISINGSPIDVVIDSVSTLSTIDNDATIKNKIPTTIPYIQLLEYFGFATSDLVELEVEKDGESLKYAILPEQLIRGQSVKVIPDPIPLCYLNGRSLFWHQVQEKDNAFYIQYNKCASREYPPSGFKGDIQMLPLFSEFHKAVIDSIVNNDFDKVIFDIRFNSGGNSIPGTELVKDLSTIQKLNAKGKLFVIIGRASYSSAVLNILDFKDMTNAILVGEETYGKPNHLGEVKIMKLPSSGLMVQYSTKYFKRTNNDLKTITPDIIIEPSFADFKGGRDPVYEWIVRQ